MSGNTPNVSTTNGNGEGAGCPVNHGKGTPNVDNGAHSYDYKSDRNATSEECIYTTSNGVPMPHPYGTLLQQIVANSYRTFGLKYGSAF